MMISFFAPGEPKPQGSKNQFGGESCKLLAPWRSLISVIARQAFGGIPPLKGSCKIDVAFHFARPKNHFGTGKRSAILKPDAPTWKASKPDSDKLLRAVYDALKGIVVDDDCQFVSGSFTKGYGDQPGAQIRVEEMK